MTTVRIEGLQKWYRGWFGPSRAALAPVNLTIEAGETLLLLGPNGAGKSTLLALIASVRRPSAGSVYLDDQPVERPEARTTLGYLPERPRLPPSLSVFEFLMACARMHGLDAEDATQGVQWVIERLRLKRRVDQACGTLSAGLAQRVALGQALVHAPSVLLLDEPIVALDPETAEDVISVLTELREAGATLLIATHRLGSLARVADRAVLLRRGRLLELGTIDQVLSRTTSRVTFVLPPGVDEPQQGQSLASNPPLRVRRVSQSGRKRLLAAVEEAGGRVLSLEPELEGLGGAPGDLEETLA